nr:putative deoxyribonuclease RhsC [Chlamydiota bacterium]
SKRHDAETGLIYFGRRYYDPELGRFITADPEGYMDSANLYAFVLNNPLIQHDLYGLIMAYYNPKWINPSLNTDFTHPYQNLAGVGWNDLYQSLAGTVHGSFQNVINSALEFSRHASGMAAFGIGSQANQQWQSSSERWLQDILRADPSHPGYRGMFQASYVGTDIAFAFVPFGMVTKIDKARKAAPLALKTGRTVKRFFQSSKASTRKVGLSKDITNSLKIFNTNQKRSLLRFNRKKPSNAQNTIIRELPSGGFCFQANSPSRHIPGSFARFEKQIDFMGNTMQYTKTTFGTNGQIIHVKDKISNKTFTFGK